MRNQINDNIDNKINQAFTFDGIFHKMLLMKKNNELLPKTVKTYNSRRKQKKRKIFKRIPYYTRY